MKYGMGLLSLVWLCALAGCPDSSPTPAQLSVLKTNVAGNLVLFPGAKRGGVVTQEFVLYNDGRVPIRLESMEMTGDTFAIFQVTPRLNTPVTLQPGESNGMRFTIDFHPDSSGKFRASLVFFSPNVENVDDDGNFLVHLYGQALDDGTGGTGLRMSCKGEIDFGARPKDVSADQSCELLNESGKPIELTNVTYKLTDGKQADFRWLNPLLPLTLGVGQRTTTTIRFTPSSAKSEAQFSLTTNPPLPSGPLLLKVKGSALP